MGGAAELEGKQALRWPQLSCCTFRDHAVRLQLFAPAYDLVDFPRSLMLPNGTARWSLTSLREKLRTKLAAILHRIDCLQGRQWLGSVGRKVNKREDQIWHSASRGTRSMSLSSRFSMLTNHTPSMGEKRRANIHEIRTSLQTASPKTTTGT